MRIDINAVVNRNLQDGDVRISFLGKNAWTFRTLENHVVYDNTQGSFPSQISFALFDLGQEQIGAFVIAQGNFNNWITEALFHGVGASAVEDQIWSDWQSDIQQDCGKQ